MTPAQRPLPSPGAAGVVIAAAALTSCVAKGHPLSNTGTVDIRLDVAAALFAVDQLGPDGKPPEARQTPHQTGVTLAMTEEGQPAWGAYVDVRVEPPEALTLSSDPDEAVKSCAATNGTFRCTGSDKGIARLRASSEGPWSGTANLIVSWGGTAPRSQPITVLPAGLPQDTTGFALLVGGLDASKRVLATYEALTCTMGPVPDDLGSPWRAGKIRSRQASVTAAGSQSEPAALANAPVIISALSAEAALSLDADCADRVQRLRVQLDAAGQSPPFYLCFSDNGGTLNFAVTSGQKALDPQPQVIADPEPRLLRVRALQTQVPVSLSPVDLFEVSAYNADRVRIALPVDLTMTDSTVIALDIASITLNDAGSSATVIHGTPLNVGTTALHVSPLLFSMPDCVSPPIEVVTGNPMEGVVNGCDPAAATAAAGDIIIQFPMGSTPAQYSPACVKIHQGAHVTFTGNFGNFPLAPGPEGDPGNPILFTANGFTATFTFPTAGSYGYESTADPSTMLGAVFVVP